MAQTKASTKASTPLLTAESAQAERKWHVIDVAGLTLGRAVTQIATVLRGKHKATYTPHVDSGDFVIVVNASKVALTLMSFPPGRILFPLPSRSVPE